MWCKWRTGDFMAAEVIESKAQAGGGHLYYVHYRDFNRRMDEWVTRDRIVLENPSGDTVEDEEIVAEDEHGIKVRGRKRKSEDVVHFVDPPHHEHEGMDEASIMEHEQVTKVKNVSFIELGRHRMETWYFSPFPKEYYADGVVETMYICEFCLKFFVHKAEHVWHLQKCVRRHPPGDEIYRKDGVAVFEVDGAVEKFYCQNLCYLAKLFLDHKTLYYDVDLFLFYIICEYDAFGFHIVGYFSKEKYSDQGYNLACILTLPCHQRKGYGRFIIQFSYELSKKEERVGSPEKPLSDLGYVSYRSYWSWVLLRILKDSVGKELSIIDLSLMTSILPSDIISTLQHLRVVKYKSGEHILCVAPELVDEKFARLDSKKGAVVDPEYIHWAPLPIQLKKDKWSYRAKSRRNEGEE